MSDPTKKTYAELLLERAEKKSKPENISKTLRYPKETWESFANICSRLKKHPTEILVPAMEKFIEDMVGVYGPAIINKPKMVVPPIPDDGTDDDQGTIDPTEELKLKS